MPPLIALLAATGLNGKNLIREGQRIGRPCTYLRLEGSDYAAVWGGEGVLDPPDGPYQHTITVERRVLEHDREHQHGCLGVYRNLEDPESGRVLVGTSAKLPDRYDGQKLFSAQDVSLPPVDGVFLLGSESVQEWLKSMNWRTDEPPNTNFPDKEPVEEYEHCYQRQLPLYTGAAHAVLGGWHFPWPDGDWRALVDERLVLWTFADAEPWVEVWRAGEQYKLVERIT